MRALSSQRSNASKVSKFGRSLHTYNAKITCMIMMKIKYIFINDKRKCKDITYTERAVTISGFKGSGFVSDTLKTGMSVPTRN